MMQKHLTFRIAFFAVVVILWEAVPKVEATPMRLIGVLRGTYTGNEIGRACEGLGDINKDGYADFLVSERGPGLLHLYWGGPHPFNNPPAYIWTNHNNLYFCPVNVGDVNCDSINDFIAAFDYSDSVKLFTGMWELDTASLVLFADSSPGSDHWLYEIAGGGDNNDDGKPEFWIYRDDNYNQDTIRGYIGCDWFDAIPDVLIHRPPNPQFNFMMGEGFCNTCDPNGDGIPDIIWGEYDGTESTPGRACIVWGREQLPQSPDLVFYGDPEDVRSYLFGVDIACLGDISGDGIDDLWVHRFGRGYIYFGGQPFDTIPDVVVDYWRAYWVENVGDINNDGWNDVILVDPNFPASSISFLYCGPGMDTLIDVMYSETDYRSALLKMGITSAVTRLGTSFSRAGDVDGDGIDDILIGSFTFDADWLNHGILFVQAGWNGNPTDVGDEDENVQPSSYSLGQNRPNPFNSGTTIEFSLPKSGYVQLRIYNLLGELVCEPVHESLPAGEHRFSWDGKDTAGRPTPTGVYLYKLSTKDCIETKKMILLK